MFGLFSRGPALDDASAQWIFEVYAWALENFGADVFFDQTILVLPTNEHFPGRVSSVPGMAGLIFDRVREYAAMRHWPCRLIDQNVCPPLAPPRVAIEGDLRGPGHIDDQSVDEALALLIPYDPTLINNPEALIAGFAHILAHYLAAANGKPPPGGEENWAYATEVLTVFMGFGVMLCNTALSHPVRSCASCAPRADRSSNLSQFDLTYALAVFGTLKGLDDKAVTRHLKPSLRGFYRKAVREVAGNPLTARLRDRSTA